MTHPVLVAVFMAAALVAAGCSGSSSSNPMTPGTVVAKTITGTWVGASADSTGTMMGAGLSASMMAGTTWKITQTGNAFTGVMQFPGYGMRAPMTVSGTINGTTATFVMTIPAGSMMTGGCAALASGTFDMDDLMTQMHGTYAGSNTCEGPFDHGQLSLARR